MASKELTWEREMFEGADEIAKATLTDEQQALFRDIQDLEKKMYDRRHDSRYTRQQNEEFRQSKLFEIETRFYNANAKMAAALEDEDKKYRDAFMKRAEADPARLLVEQRRWEARYAGMSKDKLEAEAEKYLSSDGPAWTPDRLDLLGAALNRAKVKKIIYAPGGDRPEERTFREWVELRHGHEPWRKGREAFYTAKQMYESELGQATVLNSAGQLETVEIEKIYTAKTSMEEDGG